MSKTMHDVELMSAKRQDNDMSWVMLLSLGLVHGVCFVCHIVWMLSLLRAAELRKLTHDSEWVSGCELAPPF